MLDRENAVLRELTKKFAPLEGKVAVTGERRIFAEVPKEIFMDVIQYAASGMKFEQLCTITGLDAGEGLQFIYHLANEEGIMLNLKLTVSKDDPAIKTVTGIYNGATFYERELEGMLGARVEGLPQGRHYPLPDNWPEGQYPLRKDWKPGTAELK